MITRQNVFKIAALLSIITACYHFIGIFYLVNKSSSLRHTLFVITNLFCCYGFITRPKYFVFIFFILIIQQFNIHGNSLIRQWNNSQTINWIDLSIIILLPIFLINLIIEFWQEKMLSNETRIN